MINKLRQIGQGFWQADGSTDKLVFDRKTGCGDLELWRTKWCARLAENPERRCSQAGFTVHVLRR